MLKLIIFLLLGFSYISSENLDQSNVICEKSNIKYKFTKCKKRRRNGYLFFNLVIYYFDIICNDLNNLLPRIVEGLDCSFSCPAEYDSESRLQKCSICPENTYSTGETFSILGQNQEWNLDILSKFSFICASVSRTGEINHNCTGFTISEDGTHLVSGSTNEDNRNYIADIIFSVNFKRDGFLEIKYLKDTLVNQSIHKGTFRINIEDDVVLLDADLSINWTIFKVKVQKGLHTFMISYFYEVEQNNHDFRDLKARIEYIFIDGYDIFDNECKKCVNGYAPRNSSSCIFCMQNIYCKKTCIDCPKDSFSFPHSVGSNSCLLKPPCEIDDYSLKIFINEEGKRIKNYYLPKQIHCNQETGVKVSQQFVSIGCPAGFKDLNNSCVPCENGYTSSMSDSLECVKCAENEFTLNYYNLTNLLYSNSDMSNSCFYKSKRCIYILGFQINRDKLSSVYKYKKGFIFTNKHRTRIIF